MHGVILEPGPRGAKPRSPAYVETNYGTEVKNIFLITVYLGLLCEFF